MNKSNVVVLAKYRVVGRTKQDGARIVADVLAGSVEGARDRASGVAGVPWMSWWELTIYDGSTGSMVARSRSNEHQKFLDKVNAEANASASLPVVVATTVPGPTGVPSTPVEVPAKKVKYNPHDNKTLGSISFGDILKIG